LTSDDRPGGTAADPLDQRAGGAGSEPGTEPAGALPDLAAAIAGLWDVELDETEMALRFEP
jgi:hypothetical protein